MRLKTSCFNKTVYRKNLTRFAPVWGCYTLCLVVAILLLYGNSGTMRRFHFANHMTQLDEIMAVVNLIYAPIVAQLLYGDLYSSRMCNMLHAFPMRREHWFLTNFLSGITFSVVPTAVMCSLALPLLAGSIFAGAASLSMYVFLASNLQFICFFGMAVFCAMLVGNRFTMVAAYGLLNAGALIVYWLIDTVYTPMLYGVITPNQLMQNLTPIYHMTNVPYIQSNMELYQLMEIFGDELKGATATFTLSEEWYRLWILAGVGLAFAALGLLLYRIRDLECAGSAVAFPILRPVFEVVCAVFVAAAAQFFLYNFLGMRQQTLTLFLVLVVGLVAGWFIGKMLTEHTTRVFTLQNIRGLAALASVFAVSLWLTHIDILNIETRLPDAEKIAKAVFCGREFTEEEDIRNILTFQADALENRAEQAGCYVLADGEWILHTSENYDKFNKDDPDNQYTYVDRQTLTYELDSGKQIRRAYNIWVDNDYVSSEAGRIAESYLTQWESVNSLDYTINNVLYKRLELILANVENVYVGYINSEIPQEETSKKLAKDVESLVAALKADCAEGNMAQSHYYHHGSFRYESDYEESGYGHTPYIDIQIEGKNNDKTLFWWVEIYPDCHHTLQWIEDHGGLAAEILEEDFMNVA